MCQNVIKNATARLPWNKKAEFNILLSVARAKKRQILWIAQDGKCHYCDRETVLPKQGAKNTGKALATLDHIVTQSDGGTDHLHNLVVACAACNSNRSNMPYDEFYALMKTPGGWEGHMKVVRAEKAARDEARRQESLRRHNELVAQEQQAAAIRRNERLRAHAPMIIKMARKKGWDLPEDPEDQIQWAIAYNIRQGKLLQEVGPHGTNLLRAWINQANFEPRKDGKGEVLVLDIHPWEHYRGDVPTEDYPPMEMAA